MPELINVPNCKLAPGDWEYQDAVIPVATRQELLDFANAMRVIGGAEILPALLPAVRGEARACLIAKAVNFQSEVAGRGERTDDGISLWDMTIFNNAELAERIGLALSLEVETQKYAGQTVSRIKLPEHIGNAARAYDAGVAFTEL